MVRGQSRSGGSRDVGRSGGKAAPDLAEAIRASGLIAERSRVVVGVSGGPDSMALLHALARLAPEMELALVVAHLDHGLRDDSSADASFVREQTGRLGVEAILERCDVRELARQGHRSLEDAGRRARYAFFECVAEERGG